MIVVIAFTYESALALLVLVYCVRFMYAQEFSFEAVGMDNRSITFPEFVGNKWTLTCLFMCATAAVIMSKLKGVECFSLGFTWWGKHAQVQVRVEPTHNSSSCIMTSDGLFNRKTCTSSADYAHYGISRTSTDQNFTFKTKEITRWEPIVPLASKPVRSQDVLLESTSQMIETERKTRAFKGQTDEGVYLQTTADKVQLWISDNKEVENKLYSKSQSALVSTDWKSGGIEDSLSVCKIADTIQSPVSKEDVYSLPDWASCLLEPLTLASVISKSKPNLQYLRRSKGWYEYAYNMRVEMLLALEGRGANSTSLTAPPKAALLVRGPLHIATAKDKVVKIWDSSRRLLLERLQIAEGVIYSALDVDWEAKKAFIGSLKAYFSVWDLDKGKCIRRIQAQEGAVEAIRCNSENTCILAGARSLQKSSVSVFDSRILKESVGFVTSTIPGVLGIQSCGHGCYVRDRSNCISAYDMRMLRALLWQSFCVRSTYNTDIEKAGVVDQTYLTFTTKNVLESTATTIDNEKWWDADAELLSDDYSYEEYEYEAGVRLSAMETLKALCSPDSSLQY